ncbi:hypothetical protein B296_00017175 [Ensete ventricosum]|uniref:Ubiquitin-like domain-containing protein n=1 Tax=Ensete ventricosum TaxID=4639 RepID=A0A427B566_ENSVE|nr:hypothetical protein B296_00017175 [Ensete ventricosum]
MRLRISYGAARRWNCLTLTMCPHSTGELKKLLTAETGLQPAEQRLFYKGKEKGDGEFLDVCGLKNRSKVVLTEDPTSLERRYVEMRKNARIQSAQRAISAVSMEVDKLADQVRRPHHLHSSTFSQVNVQFAMTCMLILWINIYWFQVTTIEKSITERNKVAEVQITTLIELLMRQAVKLECIHTEGDASSQKNLQVCSIFFPSQKYLLSR